MPRPISLPAVVPKSRPTNSAAASGNFIATSFPMSCIPLFIYSPIFSIASCLDICTPAFSITPSPRVSQFQDYPFILLLSSQDELTTFIYLNA